MLGVHVYQPVASHLGYDKPGGFRFEVPVEGAVRLADVLAACGQCDVDVSKLLSGYGATCVVAVNRALSTQGLQTEVKDGDEVSVFGLVSGG